MIKKTTVDDAKDFTPSRLHLSESSSKASSHTSRRAQKQHDGVKYFSEQASAASTSYGWGGRGNNNNYGSGRGGWLVGGSKAAKERVLVAATTATPAGAAVVVPRPGPRQHRRKRWELNTITANARIASQRTTRSPRSAAAVVTRRKAAVSS